jgi:hypothetical protein
VRGGIKKSSSKGYGSLSSTLPGRTDFGKAGFLDDGDGGMAEVRASVQDGTGEEARGVSMGRHKVDTSGRAKVL